MEPIGLLGFSLETGVAILEAAQQPPSLSIVRYGGFLDWLQINPCFIQVLKVLPAGLVLPTYPLDWARSVTVGLPARASGVSY